MKFPQLQKNRILDQLFVFMLIIYAGSATAFVRSMASWENLIGLFLPIIFALIIGFWHRINISRNFIYLVLGYTLYNFILTIKFQAIHPRFFGIYLISFLIAYITIAALRYRFFIYYERILYFLAIIALVFWGIHIITPVALSNILSQLSFKPGSSNVDSNIIIYTINNLSTIEATNINIGGLSLVRNSGFAWEPGGFACLIDLAIFVNLIRTRFRLHNNIKLWVLTVTLITTFSTTGISIFLVLIVFYAYNQKFRYGLLFVPVIIGLGIYVSTLSFMSEKLVDVSEYNTEDMIENAITYENQLTPQRLESLEIDFVDFLNNPFFGYGGHMQERWTAKLGADIATISGIGKVMAVFGIVGILFFFYNLIKTSKELSILFRFKGWFFPFIIIIMISISYSLIFTSLLMCFWLINSTYLSRKQKIGYLLDRFRIVQPSTRIG